MTGQGPNWKRLWLVPLAVIGTVAVASFAGLYLLDFFVTGQGESVRDPAGPLIGYLSFSPGHITDSVPALAGMSAAVLGIVITVVSIIVQLSADRYTGVARMFLRDPVNVAVMGFFVVACVGGVLLSMSIRATFVPRAALLVMMGATTVGLVLMLPYFAYVFWFLEPANIIAHIRSDAVRAIGTGARLRDKGASDEAQVPTIVAMEELTDITSNSISGKDKIIASRAVDALKDFVLEYLEVKPAAAEAWFRIGRGIKDNPDFVAMDPESLRDLEHRRTWVEWKVLRQYLGIYNEALQAMPDINYLIAIDTRYIGQAAVRTRDEQLTQLVLRFFNSYLRATINAQAVRTAYNVLNQYRLLLEAMIREGEGAAAVEAVRYIQYYGKVSYDMKLTFVTETVAYDISALCQYAHERGAPEQSAMLDIFLRLDQPLQFKAQEKGLLGVRKAQVKLAAYYLDAGEEARARLIADDMRDEPAERLHAIRTELERVESKDFWEIIDRGRNFEFMSPSQREAMGVFFGWFAKLPQAQASSPD